MRILFDQCTPVPLRHALSDHIVSTAFEHGCVTLKNGELLSVAESNGFDVIVTADTNLRYQQNLSKRHIAIVVLSTTRWARIEKVQDQISMLIDRIFPGRYLEINVDLLLRSCP